MPDPLVICGQFEDPDGADPDPDPTIEKKTDPDLTVKKVRKIRIQPSNDTRRNIFRLLGPRRKKHPSG